MALQVLSTSFSTSSSVSSLAFHKPAPISFSRESAKFVRRHKPFIVPGRWKISVLRAEPVSGDDKRKDQEEEEEEEEEELAKELEGLEVEVMAGAEDRRREPSDYDRRAHIFDESSRVFQALKEKQHHRSDPDKVGNKEEE